MSKEAQNIAADAAAAEAAAKAAEEAAEAEAAAKAAEEAAAAEAAAKAAEEAASAEAKLFGLVAGVEALAALQTAEETRTDIEAMGGVFEDTGTGWHRLTLAGVSALASAPSMLPAAWCATARQVILDAEAAAEGEAA